MGDRLEEPDEYDRIILERILKIVFESFECFIWLTIKSECCEFGTDTFGSRTRKVFLSNWATISVAVLHKRRVQM